MKFLVRLIFVVTVLVAGVCAQIANQSAPGNNKHYERGGLAFDYPDGWNLTVSESQGGQSVTLARGSKTAQIVVNLQGVPIPICDFDAERTKLVNALTEKLAAQIQAGDPPSTSAVTTKFGALDVVGTQLQGFIDHKAALGDVYVGRQKRYFASLVFVRTESDELARSAWATLSTTLKVEPPAIVEPTAGPNAPMKRGVLNGMALSLPTPNYPPGARDAHVGGPVTIQVIIDESGAVVYAKAFYGDPLLREASVAAARKAKFKISKLCGEPVRATGIITYNFVAE